jgi:hypothetical protein
MAGDRIESGNVSEASVRDKARADASLPLRLSIATPPTWCKRHRLSIKKMNESAKEFVSGPVLQL